MENVNQDAMIHGNRPSFDSETGGPLQIPDDRNLMNDEAAENSATMVNEGSDDSADDSATRR